MAQVPGWRIVLVSALSSCWLVHPHIVQRKFARQRNSEIGGTFDGFNGFLNGSLPSSIPSVVLVKTHKTGSSTLANILHRLGDVRGSKFLLPMADDIFLGWPSSFPGQGQTAAEASVDVISNHAVYNSERMQYFMRSPPFFITLLREPRGQAVSAYNYFSGKQDWEQHVSWLESEASPGSTDMQSALYLNPQAHDLGWYEYVGQTRAYDTDVMKIQQWLTELDNDFIGRGLVILSEHFDAWLVLLQRGLGCDLRELSYVRLKTAEGKSEPDPLQLHRLLEVSAVDVSLYTHYKRAYSKQWFAGDVSEQNSDLVRLKRYNRQLELACGDDLTPNINCPKAVITDSPEYTCFLKKKQGLQCSNDLTAP